MDKSKNKIRLALVSPRYGAEVNGGAELQCRMFANRLCGMGYDVTVLTTTAMDYHTWENEYPCGDDEVSGVKVKRFTVRGERSKLLPVYNKLFRILGRPKRMEECWIRMQGPYVPELAEYIKDCRDEYDVFLFFTYLYYPTISGMPLVYEKSIFIPEAHDEPPFYFDCVRRLFENAKAFFFNTPEEAELVSKVYDIKAKSQYVDIGGIGIEPPEDIDGARFAKKYNVKKYILYAGRISAGKGCDELISFFSAYKAETYDDELSLVMLGKSEDIIVSADRVMVGNKVALCGEDKVGSLIMPGFVSEQDKWDAIAGATAVVVPSRYESLSMILLEAMAIGTPVLVNAASEVLLAHIRRSEGGFSYTKEENFADALSAIMAGNIKTADNAKAYVAKNYTWDVIMEKLKSMIDYVSEAKSIEFQS